MAHTGVELPYEVTVDAHVLTVVAIDGYDVMPIQVDVIVLNTGESVDFEISANQTSGKYWVRATGMSHWRENQTFASKQVGTTTSTLKVCAIIIILLKIINVYFRQNKSIYVGVV